MSSTQHQPGDPDRIGNTCGNCNLAELCLPRGLHPDEIRTLDDLTERAYPLQSGEYVFERGDDFEAIYAVRSGMIKQYQDVGSSNERILGFYLPGELLGLDAIYNGRHACTASAVETSSVCTFPYRSLDEACSRIHGLQRQICRLMSREISAENQLLLMLKDRTAAERVAGFLVNLSTRYQRLGYSAREFKLPMSREEIGNYLGLTTETVSRLFTRLQRNQIISYDRYILSIRDLDGLHALTAGNPDSDTLAV